MRRYMHEYGWKKDHFAAFSINAHANGAHNPFARFQEPISEAAYQKAGMIAEPINLMDASPMGDGAAAAVLVPADWLRSRGARQIIKIVGSAAATDTIAVHSRRDCALAERGRTLGARSLCPGRRGTGRYRCF